MKYKVNDGHHQAWFKSHVGHYFCHVLFNTFWAIDLLIILIMMIFYFL